MNHREKRSTQSSRSIRAAARGLCVVTAAGLALSTVPAVASAAPLASQAPLVAQTVIGLKQGASGTNVSAVQQALLAAGVKVPGGADGVFGPSTKSAVTAFQSRSGLSTSGEVDDATASALGLTGPAPSAGAAAGLTVGAQGDQVKQIQTALMAFGVYVSGGADGVFGAATKTAVSNFQRWNGLTVTGVVDDATSARLNSVSGSAPVAAAATATGGTFIGLTMGARGDLVKTLQRALIAAGVSVRGGADGIFGAATQTALTSYQQANGLNANGVVDAPVVERLALGSGAAAPAAAPAPTATPSSPFVGLTVGSNGASVKELQRALMQTGLTLLGGADGVFGSATKATLILFQKTNGTPQTGVLGAQDASVLGLGSAAAPQGVSNQSGFAAFGERGARVTALQQSLLKAGISFSGGADGVFGASTAGAVLAFQRREGLPATGKIDETTAARLGNAAAPAPAPPSSAGIAIDVFPVQGQCWFGDTYQAPRGGGRTHEGVDVIAGKGKLLYAVVSGRISKVYTDSPTAISGNGLRVAQDNGTYFTYLHMDSFAPGIELGVPVTAGQVIGYVGATGNAPTPHLHFEVHPNGGGAVNPYPVLKPVDACNVTAPRA